MIDHNNEIIKHGLFNFLAFVLSSILLFLIIIFFHFIYNLFSKKKYSIILFIIIFIKLMFYIFKQYKSKHFLCNYWTKGLNNSEIDNESRDYPCQLIIPKPNSCYISGIGPYIDLTPKYRPTCLDYNLIKEQKEDFLKNTKKTKYFKLSKKERFGFPLTNNRYFSPYEYGAILYYLNKSFYLDINKNVILMDLFDKNKSKYYPKISTPEIQVTLTKNGGKLDIKIQKNETLIKERESIIKNNNKQKYKNVLVMFFDTVSRVHFFRKFPKTIEFFNRFSKYEEDFKRKKMTLFQYFKYNSIYPYTDPNLRAAFFGSRYWKKGIHFANYFKKKGYIIGRVNTLCEKESVFNKKKPSQLLYAFWDHEGLSLSCIKSFYKGFLVGRLHPVLRKCLFGKDMFQYALEYLESFWTTYFNQHKLFLFQSIEGHEPTGQLIGYYDEIVYNFFNKFYNKEYFNDTAIILFSDHGMHLTGPLYLFDSQDFFNEKGLPFLFLFIPNEKKLYENNTYEKMKSNQQTFITPFDIYNTLIDLSSDNNKEYNKFASKFGTSLLNQINFKKRFCESPIYKFKFEKKTCKCKIIK